MTKSFVARRKFGALKIEVIIKIIEKRIYMKIRGIPSPYDIVVLKKMMQVKQEALKKGMGTEETLSSVGGWLILENKENTKTEEEIMEEQKEGFIKQNYEIIE